MATQVLIYEPSYRRLRDRLDAIPGTRYVCMRPDGTLQLDGQPFDQPEIECAWFTHDLFSSGPVREFMVRCLKSPTLKWMQSSAAGFDHPVFGLLAGNGVKLSTSHAAAIAIAEFVLSAVLDAWQPHARRRALQQARSWERLGFREVAGTTWLIVGIGHIGSEIASRARAFGARVIGVRRNPRGDEPADQLLPAARLHEAVPQADVLVLAAPANRDSQRLVDARLLSAMKPDSILVNIGRGALVDEAALLAALDRGTPALAILDVFDSEPLPEDSPFWTHPRVHVSPHASAAGSGVQARNDALFVENLGRYVAGEAPRYIVDPREPG